MKSKYYIIGNPAVRDKINSTVRFAWKCIVYAFALIGLIALLAIICQISAW